MVRPPPNSTVLVANPMTICFHRASWLPATRAPEAGSRTATRPAARGPGRYMSSRSAARWSRAARATRAFLARGPAPAASSAARLRRRLA